MAGNNRQVAVIPIKYKDRELALPGEIILDSDGRMFAKLNDGTVKPIRGEQFNFIQDLIKHNWHVGDQESLDYDMASWIKTGDYDPSIDYERGTILIKEYYLEPDGTEKERWRAIAPITELSGVIVNDNTGKTLEDMINDDLSDGFISTDDKLEDGGLQYVSGNTFTIVGDWLDIFLEDRKLKMLSDGNEVFSLIDHVNYDGTVTTVTLEDSVLGSSIEEVLYSIISPGETGPISDTDTYSKIAEYLEAGNNIDIDLSNADKLKISSPTDTDGIKSVIGDWIQGGGATTVSYVPTAGTLKISSVNTQRSDGEINSLIESHMNGPVEIGDNLKVGGNIDLTGFDLVWNEHTDGARITFVNPSDADETYMLFETNDNNNEYFKWGHNDVSLEEWMRLEQSGLTVNGEITGTKVWNAVYNGDVAELFDCVEHQEFEPGDVLVSMKGLCCKTSEEKHRGVVGVVSDPESYGYLLGGPERDSIDDYGENQQPVGITGRTKVKVTGDIKEHDLLVTSKKSGYATKINSDEYMPGTVFAKALEGNNGEDKKIWALIMNA